LALFTGIRIGKTGVKTGLLPSMPEYPWTLHPCTVSWIPGVEKE
jgi:hypothetical protein